MESYWKNGTHHFFFSLICSQVLAKSLYFLFSSNENAEVVKLSVKKETDTFYKQTVT